MGFFRKRTNRKMLPFSRLCWIQTILQISTHDQPVDLDAPVIEEHHGSLSNLAI